jgi:DNA ligase-1
LYHLEPWLDAIDRDVDVNGPLHGELYVHGWSLQRISSYTKKLKEDYDKLQLWVYDIADRHYFFKDRWTKFEKGMKQFDSTCPIKVVPTEICHDYTDAKYFHDKWVAEGYEGAMLKNFRGQYVFQFRSNDLEKVKQYKHEEFEIVGGVEWDKKPGHIKYVCVTEDGVEFEVVPRGTMEDRQEMWKNLDNDIGKMMTVRFAEWSDDGRPLQPTGIPEAEAVRDYE